MILNILDIQQQVIGRGIGLDKLSISIIMKKMTEFLKVFEPIELMDLETKYTINDPLAVISFLRKNRDMFDFLNGEAFEVINKYFPSAKLALDVMTDPETDEEMLVLYIQTESKVQDALRKLRELDERWWLDKASMYKNLCIHLQV